MTLRLNNLIDAELSNVTPKKVTGWMRLARHGKRPLGVVLNLDGDFGGDIRGKAIRLSNLKLSDEQPTMEQLATTERFSSVQLGFLVRITTGGRGALSSTGPVTIEWFSYLNGWTILKLELVKLRIFDQGLLERGEEIPEEVLKDAGKQLQVEETFLSDLLQAFSRQSSGKVKAASSSADHE